MSKKCSSCKKVKPLDCYRKDKSRRGGRHHLCRQCSLLYQREYNRKNWEYVLKRSRRYKSKKIEYDRQYRRKNWVKLKHRGLMRSFGITGTDYRQMWNKQNGLCYICGKTETVKVGESTSWLSVDHCHKTGTIRKLLCGKCNSALGLANDDPVILRKMADYIESHKTD